MNLPTFPDRWPPRHPERLQVYSMATPNGQKVGVMLEETGLSYEPHLIDITRGDQHDPEYEAINPNEKIPAIIDPHGPDHQPVVMAESGAILLYLADKTESFLSREPRARLETLQWLFFQMAHVGPFFGQFGHFYKFARDKTSDNYALERYAGETLRLLKVLDARLKEREYLVGEQFSIADIATFPWINALDFYESRTYLELERFANVSRWVASCMARPGVQRGVRVCSQTQ